jgi:hypothetical protein
MIAIDTLVGRCITFLQRANGANAMLRQNFPDGYSLDPSHAPHLTLWQSVLDSGDPAETSGACQKAGTSDSLQLKHP